MKKTIALVLSLFVFAQVFATDVVPVESARKASKNFLSARYKTMADIKTTDLTLKHTELNENGEPVYYHFQIKDKGFILVSATDNVIPVLAYSIESNLESNESVDFMLGSYKNYISQVQAYHVTDANAAKAWAQYTADNFVQTKADLKSVDRLTTTIFNQQYPYNTYCPFDAATQGDRNKKVPNGCVSVAMGTILNYFRYPTKGFSGVSYIPEKYDRQEVKFRDYTYNHDAITDAAYTDDGELAKLLYHAGVSVRMGYGPTGSGAASAEAMESLKYYWQYNQSAYMQTQDVFSGGAKMWGDSILKPQLDKCVPIYYSAQNKEENGSGHAFIIDGYKEVMEGDNVVTYFRVNWGWGGQSNGDFLIDMLNPPIHGDEVEDGNFIYHVGVMLNMTPPDSACQKPAEGFIRNTASFGSISDGAGHVDYPNNTNRTWMLASPDAKSYMFNFGRLNTEKLQDIITIYNGPTEASGVAYTFSGHYTFEELPEPFTVTADSVLVKFTSDGSNTDKGFVLYYTTSFKSSPSCSSSPVFITTPKGSISVGGQDGKNYRAQANCTWNLRVNGASAYNINFKKFEMGEGDFVEILNHQDVLLARYDMHNYPKGYLQFPSASLLRVKVTIDNWDEGEGFVMEYAAGTSRIEDPNSGLNDVTVYPNPATDFITLKFNTEEAENVAVKVVDVTGKQVYSEQINHAGGEFQRQFNISDLSEGFYIMNLETSKGKTVCKFIVH